MDTPTALPTSGKSAIGFIKSIAIAAVPVVIAILAAKMIGGYIPKSAGGTKA